MPESTEVDLVVVGAGPGGYAAAFYAADRGRRVVLVEQDERLGGVCLQRGCIPSKALLHAAALIPEAKRSGSLRGIVFGDPKVDLERLQSWKRSILEKLEQGIRGLAKRRGVEILRGRAQFETSQTLRVETPEGRQVLRYQKAILAVGSKPALPTVFAIDHPRIMTSTEALELSEIPKRLLVVGGGYIGFELGVVYATLGSHVVLVEALDRVLAGVDEDLTRPVVRAAESSFAAIRLKTTVTALAPRRDQIQVTFTAAAGAPEHELYDRVLVAVGRVPNGDELGLEQTRVTRTDWGFIIVDAQQRTEDPAIYAIGDIVGGPLLAHKASHEARVAINTILGAPAPREPAVIPAVVFTDPEIAWCGLSELEAQARGLKVDIVRYPWSASGRALTLDRTEGMTKLLIEPESERVLGVGIVGVGAGELISEAVLAIQMGATAKELARAVHPHPTLSETLMEAAQLFYGTATHAFARRPTR